ncbi:MAG: hypothetical protein FWJ61_03670 [Limnochordales bacterium]
MDKASKIWLAGSVFWTLVFGTASIAFDNYRFIVFALPAIMLGFVQAFVIELRRRQPQG